MGKLMAIIFKNFLDSLLADESINNVDVPVAAQDSLPQSLDSMEASLPPSPTYQISITDYLMGRAQPELMDPELLENAYELLRRVNLVLKSCPMQPAVNSGYRRQEDNAAAGGRPRSNHLVCKAIDLADADGSLKLWAKQNEQLLVDAGLWCEDGAYTMGWLHLQSVPPKSGKRWFVP